MVSEAIVSALSGIVPVSKEYVIKTMSEVRLGVERLKDVYRELRKVIGGAQAARRLTSAGA